MTNQLLLIDSRPAWRLDRATRAQGLEGVANARAVLQAVDAKRAAERDADDTTTADAAASGTATDDTVIDLDGAQQPRLPLPDAA
ncbi:MAG: hypothetical protein AAGA90_22720 [Actinomycetota bacterium]